MTCPGCEEAETDPHSVIAYLGCMSCDARAIAKSDEAEAREAKPDDLQAVMRAVWPNVDDYKRGRPLVWRWVQRLEAK